MTLTRVHGGLGNQLFQYAAGINASRQTGSKLFTIYSGNANRIFMLGQWPSVRRTFRILPFQHAARPFSVMAKMELVSKYFNCVTENQAGPFIPLAVKARYLDGYWQNEEYFQQSARFIRDILSEFSVGSDSKLNLSAKNGAWGAVHVRLGDYVSDPRAADLLGAKTEDYFTEAISSSDVRCRDRVLVFSDEPMKALELVRKQIPKAELAVSLLDRGSICSEFDLLKSCRSFVIPNSTFSWWAAWISNADQVVAPKQWYRSPILNSYSPVPARWKTV
jgi:Glycosyl transferase family 11